MPADCISHLFGNSASNGQEFGNRNLHLGITVDKSNMLLTENLICLTVFLPTFKPVRCSKIARSAFSELNSYFHVLSLLPWTLLFFFFFLWSQRKMHNLWKLCPVSLLCCSIVEREQAWWTARLPGVTHLFHLECVIYQWKNIFLNLRKWNNPYSLFQIFTWHTWLPGCEKAANGNS